MLKGSERAKCAGKKAAETRARNKALNGIKAEGSKSRGISVAKVRFKKLEESNYHKLSITSPVDIYIHKTLNRMYISPHRTEIKLEKDGE